MGVVTSVSESERRELEDDISLAEELRRTPGLTLKPVYSPLPAWLYFPEQCHGTTSGCGGP